MYIVVTEHCSPFMLQVRARIKPTSGQCRVEWHRVTVFKCNFGRFLSPYTTCKRWTNDWTAVIRDTRWGRNLARCSCYSACFYPEWFVPSHPAKVNKNFEPRVKAPSSLCRKASGGKAASRQSRKRGSRRRSLSLPFNSCRAYNDLSSLGDSKSRGAGLSTLARGTRAERDVRVPLYASSSTRHPFAREKLLLRCKLYYIVTSLMKRSLITLIYPRFLLAFKLVGMFHAYYLVSWPIVTRNEYVLCRVFNKIHEKRLHERTR